MKTIAKTIALGLIRFYQKAISPIFPPCCRFIPSCSEYCYQSIMRFGVRKGGLLGLKRIRKCHPFGPYGYDPVPLTLDNKKTTHTCGKGQEK